MNHPPLAQLSAVQAHVVRAQPEWQLVQQQKILLPSRNLQIKLALFRIPVQGEEAGLVLQSGNSLGESLGLVRRRSNGKGICRNRKEHSGNRHGKQRADSLVSHSDSIIDRETEHKKDMLAVSLRPASSHGNAGPLGVGMASSGFEWITIEGFKSIRKIHELPLRQVNVLIGANGSGKSNFLEAFLFFGFASFEQTDSYVETRGGAEKFLYLGSKTTTEIRLQLGSPDGLTRNAIFRAAAGDRLAGAVDWQGTYPKGPTFNCYRFSDTGEHSPFKKTSNIDDNRGLSRLGGNLAAYLYRLRKNHAESFRLIENTVRQVAPFFDGFLLEPLARNPNTIKLEWRHKNSEGYWDASSLSDGTLRFIALATLFLQPPELRPSVILVDEPELGLHPVAIALLASLIRQASVNTQVIAATQSPRLVDYFDPEDILVADRVKGATTVERLESEPLAEWLDEYSLGELWEKNEFAGRPAREL
jgi:predicted ATPase